MSSGLLTIKPLKAQETEFSKTAIFFSLSTPDNIPREIKEALGLQEITEYEKYLDLLPLVGRRKKRKLKLYQREGLEEIARLGR